MFVVDDRLDVQPAVLQQCTSHADKEADQSPAKNTNASVLKVAPKRAAEGSVRDSDMEESPTKRPRIGVTSESGVALVEISTKTADSSESSPVSKSGEQSENHNQGNHQGGSGGPQKPVRMSSSQPHRLLSELPLPLSVEHIMDPKSGPEPKWSFSQPNSSATNSEYHPGRTSATLPRSWKLETPKPKGLWTGTNPSKPYPYRHVLSCGPGKQSKPPLNNTAKLEGLSSSLSVPQMEGIKNRPGCTGLSPQDRGNLGISPIVSKPSNTGNTSSSTSVSPAHAKVKCNDHDTSQEEKKCASYPQSPSTEVEDTLTKDDSPVVLFSEDEEEVGVCGSDAATMLSSQMNRQIDRVQMFLRMDRLRRTKPFK